MMRTSELHAFILGVRDGWGQPFDLSSSTNVDHLERPDSPYMVHEWLDRGINVGQILRAGRRSQAWVERFWPRRKPAGPTFGPDDRCTVCAEHIADPHAPFCPWSDC